MKKLFMFIVVIGFTFSILGSPVQSSATKNTNDSETESSYTKKITNYLVVFENREFPDSTYHYDIGGWEGTLKLDHWQSAGTDILAYYSGTVNCTGTCVMATDLNEE